MARVNYGLLHRLGLSALAINCYANLFAQGSASASMLAMRVQAPRNSIYPLLNHLEQCGFIIKFTSDIGPIFYAARPLNQALAIYHAKQRLALNDLIRQQEIQS